LVPIVIFILVPLLLVFVSINSASFFFNGGESIVEVIGFDRLTLDLFFDTFRCLRCLLGDSLLHIFRSVQSLFVHLFSKGGRCHEIRNLSNLISSSIREEKGTIASLPISIGFDLLFGRAKEHGLLLVFCELFSVVFHF
jgi:hypothetical protein